MTAPGGGRNRGGEDRFYSPPAMRRYYQEQQQQQRQQQQQLQSNRPSKPKSKPSSVDSKKRIESDDCSSSTTTAPSVSSSFSPPSTANANNLDRFLEHTTPVVPAQHFPKTSMRRWGTREDQFHPYFILEDLWESFKEWSAYGAGVPLVLNESDFVVQYYVPYLSGIQLYMDPSRPSSGPRRPGEESDSDSSRETSSDGSSECDTERGANDIQGARSQQNAMRATTQSFNKLSMRHNPVMGTVADEGDISNPPGLLVFEYLEQNQPFNREPLADKITFLASQFPALKTLRSCDLTSASWLSVAWYPIYRIPQGPTLQNLEACFLTYHTLSTPLKSTGADWPCNVPTARDVHNVGVSLKLPLPTFGLAFYKFQVSFWNPHEVHESPKLNYLLQAADNQLRFLQVKHPDFSFFMSRYPYWR